MLWLKAFHVFGVITWFAGIFYLPRLFVYHAATEDDIGLKRFIIMERRLYIMMSIGAVLAIGFGASMLIAAPGYMSLGWLRMKMLLVAALVVYHLFCFKLLREFAAGRNRHGARWYRIFNEAPALLLVGIVILAVVKPL
jgi:putative membrane protein